MPSGYPNALDSFPTNKNDATEHEGDHAVTHNNLADAINKMELELGADPAADYSTVGSRLVNIESHMGELRHSYRNVISAYGTVAAAATVGTYLFTNGNMILSTASTANNIFGLTHLFDTDYPTDEDQKLRVRFQLFTNSVAPATSWTAGLYPIASVGGAANLNAITLGSVVSGSTAVITTPPPNSSGFGQSGDFNFPSNGGYVLGVANSGTTAANSRVAIVVHLHYRST